MEKVWLESYPKSAAKEIRTDTYANLIEMMQKSVERSPNQAAYMNMGESLSYKQLDELSLHFATYLQQNLKLEKNERVALMMPNTFQYPIATFGILRAGLTVVNVNPMYTTHELIHQLNDSGATTIVVMSSFAANLQSVLKHTQVKNIILTHVGDLFSLPKRTFVNMAIKYIKRLIPAYNLPNAVGFRKALKLGATKQFVEPEISGDNIAFLQYTGGTTGVAKGAILTHKNIIANLLQAKWVAEDYVKDSKNRNALIVLPLYHAFALTMNCLLFLELNLTAVLVTNPRDIKGVVSLLERTPVIAITGLNTLFNAWLNVERFKRLDFSALKLTVSGGMMLQQNVAADWKKLTGNSIMVGYGMTEASPLISACISDLPHQQGSIGVPVVNTDIKIINDDGEEVAMGDAGELCIKGPQVMQGYWQRPEATAEVLVDGWLKTGDIVVMDENYQMKIVDRKKDMIIVSGFNVYPSEIEDAVMLNYQVKEAAVIGVPHPTTGESVKLFVVKRDKNLTADQLRLHCKQYLTNYKLPREIEFCDDLPKSHVGKVLRRELYEQEMKKRKEKV